MFTRIYLCLPLLTHVYPYIPLFSRACFLHLPMFTPRIFTHAYLYLPLFPSVYLCLLLFNYVYHCLLVLVYLFYPFLPMFTGDYLLPLFTRACLQMLTHVYTSSPMFTHVYLCL